MADVQITAEEMRQIREMRNADNRAWWHRMTAEERREKRLQYARNRLKNKHKNDDAVT